MFRETCRLIFFAIKHPSFGYCTCVEMIEGWSGGILLNVLIFVQSLDGWFGPCQCLEAPAPSAAKNIITRHAMCVCSVGRVGFQPMLNYSMVVGF